MRGGGKRERTENPTEERIGPKNREIWSKKEWNKGGRDKRCVINEVPAKRVPGRSFGENRRDIGDERGGRKVAKGTTGTLVRQAGTHRFPKKRGGKVVGVRPQREIEVPEAGGEGKGATDHKPSLKRGMSNQRPENARDIQT